MAITWITTADLQNPTHPDAQYAVDAASWILYKLTAEKYPGVRMSTEWYGLQTTSCYAGCYSYASASPLDALVARPHHHYFLDLSYYDAPRQVRLRHKPINSVSLVKVGTETVAASAYYVANNAYLVHQNNCGWELNRGLEVTYSHGVNPPAAGKRAAERLANEFILSFQGSEQCRLPDRVTSVSRQGTSYTIMDPMEFMKDGRTGIYEVDLFIAAANPAGARLRPKVFSPDKPRGERRG